jgi:hypothetical protein
VKRVTSVVALAGLAAVAYGDGSDRTRAMEDMRDKEEYFAKKCGGRITGTIDWQSFAGHYQHKSDTELSASAYCNEVVDSMGWVCDNDPVAKPAMQRIHKMRCSFDGKLGRDIGLDLRGDTLFARLSWDTSNVNDRIKDWVDNLPSGDDAAAPATDPDDADGDSPPPSSSPPKHDGHLSVRQTRERAEAQPELDELAAGVRKACGGAIPITLDWASFDGHLGGGTTATSAAGWCNQQVEQIGAMCKRNAEEKRTIARELKSVTCHWDDSGGKEFKFSLANSALVVGYTFDSADSGHNLVRYLWNTLD